MRDQQKGYFELILFSLFIGSVGIFVKLLKGMDVYSIIFFRYAIASLFILLVVASQNKLKELSLVRPFQTMLMGLFLGIASLFYFSSIIHTTVSNAVFLLYTAPIFSVILAKIFLKEHIDRETIIGTIITLLGIFFILDPRTFSLSADETLGNLMGLAAGFFYSAQALAAKPIMKYVSGYYAAFWQAFVIGIMFVFFLKIESGSVVVENIWQLLGIGIIGAGIPTILFMRGIKKVKAQKIFIITALEPLAATIFAVIFLSEVPTYMTIIGATMILYGVYRIANKKTGEIMAEN